MDTMSIVPAKEATVIPTLTPDQIDLLKRTIGKNLTDDEFLLGLQLARNKGLDPFSRQIHFWKDAQNRLSLVIGIDGYRSIADRTGTYCPGEVTNEIDEHGLLISTTVTNYKRYGTEWRPVTATSYFVEARKNTPTWNTMPKHMNMIRADAFSLRRGWPEAFAGTYTKEEIEGIVIEDAPLKRPVAKHHIPPPAVVEAQVTAISETEELNALDAQDAPTTSQAPPAPPQAAPAPKPPAPRPQAPTVAPATPRTGAKPINEKQVAMLLARAGKAGWAVDDLREYVQETHHVTLEAIPWPLLDTILTEVTK